MMLKFEDIIEKGVKDKDAIIWLHKLYTTVNTEILLNYLKQLILEEKKPPCWIKWLEENFTIKYNPNKIYAYKLKSTGAILVLLYSYWADTCSIENGYAFKLLSDSGTRNYASPDPQTTIEQVLKDGQEVKEFTSNIDFFNWVSRYNE